MNILVNHILIVILIAIITILIVSIIIITFWSCLQQVLNLFYVNILGHITWTQQNRNCTQGASVPTELDNFLELHPRGPPRLVPTGNLFNPCGLSSQVLPHGARFVGAWPQCLLLQRLCPTFHLSSALTTRPGYPCTSTILLHV